MQVSYWPEIPEAPNAGAPVLVRVALGTVPRPEARREARAVLSGVLGAWIGRQPVLEETPHGPVIRGEKVNVSLAYGAGEAWIGLIRGGRIGVDVMAVEPFPELNAVALDYLGPEAAAQIRAAADPARAFAAAWTEHEARLKCAKSGLTEWPASRHETVFGISTSPAQSYERGRERLVPQLQLPPRRGNWGTRRSPPLCAALHAYKTTIAVTAIVGPGTIQGAVAWEILR